MLIFDLDLEIKTTRAEVSFPEMCLFARVLFRGRSFLVVDCFDVVVVITLVVMRVCIFILKDVVVFGIIVASSDDTDASRSNSSGVLEKEIVSIGKSIEFAGVDRDVITIFNE